MSSELICIPSLLVWLTAAALDWILDVDSESLKPNLAQQASIQLFWSEVNWDPWSVFWPETSKTD